MQALFFIVAAFSISGCSTLAAPQTATSDIRLATDSSTQVLGERLLNAYETERPDAVLALTPGTRSTAIEKLKSGEVDAALLLHPPTDQTLYQIVIGYDYIVFITTADNTMVDIDRTTARAIFGNQPVKEETSQFIPTIREQDSSAYLAFEDLIMRGAELSTAAQIATSDSSMLQIVANTPGTIGYVPHQALTEDVKVLAYEGVSPTLENVSSNRYPLVTSVVFACRSEPDGALADLLDWILSENGQNVVKLMMPGVRD